jgi:mono/diheme cytochrome c family protein
MNAVVHLTPQAGALATTQGSGRMAVADIIAHVAMVQEVMRAVMKKDVHFGVIPGTDKPTLLKPGAEVLCMAFRIADSYEVEDLSADGLVRYRVTCTGTHQTTGTVLGTGMGEASSGEEKYKWRKATSPQEYDETPANLRRTKHVKKRNGEGYSVQQVRTEPADLANTVLKMANKRAKMAMVLNVTAASDCFAQDLEDMDEALRDHLTRHGEATPAQAEQPAGPSVWPDDVFAKKLPTFLAAIAKGKTAVEIIAWAETKGALTEAQKAAIRGPVQDAQPPITYAAVADAIQKAQNREALYLAADLIKSVADEPQRVELTAMFEQRDQQLPE